MCISVFVYVHVQVCMHACEYNIHMHACTLANAQYACKHNTHTHIRMHACMHTHRPTSRSYMPLCLHTRTLLYWLYICVYAS